MIDEPNERQAIVITGSSGLIGSRLIRVLGPHFRIIGLDIKAPTAMPQGAEWIECDLTDDQSVNQTLHKLRDRVGIRLASVIHLAAYYDFSGQPSPLYKDLTVEGSRRLIRGLRSFEVEQLIFSSSLLVMKPVGEHAKWPLTESSPTRAEWDYPRSKLEAEKVLREERGTVPLLILRIAGVYDEDGHSLPIVHQLQRIREKQFESLFFPGDAEHGQPFVHLDDLVDCFCKAIENRAVLPPEELLLIAEPEVTSYREMQHIIGRLVHGQEWPAIPVPAPAAKLVAWAKEKLSSEEEFIRPWMIDLADDHYPVEIARAKQRLNWQPTHRLSDVLPEMIRRLNDNPREWYALNNLPWPE